MSLRKSHLLIPIALAALALSACGKKPEDEQAAAQTDAAAEAQGAAGCCISSSAKKAESPRAGARDEGKERTSRTAKRRSQSECAEAGPEGSGSGTREAEAGAGSPVVAAGRGTTRSRRALSISVQMPAASLDQDCQGR